MPIFGEHPVELGLAKGKKVHDKRADMARKTADREAKALLVLPGVAAEVDRNPVDDEAVRCDAVRYEDGEVAERSPAAERRQGEAVRAEVVDEREARAAQQARPGHAALMSAIRRAAYTDDLGLLFVHAGLDPERPLSAQGDSLWWGGSAFGALDHPYGQFLKVIRGYDRQHGGPAMSAFTMTLDGGCGYGGKAVYRGMNVTKGVFADILAGDYVAQELAPASTRTIRVAGEDVALKCDLRCYAYAGQVQLIAARLWQGQTTNFRTPGGGFAPVLPLDEAS